MPIPGLHSTAKVTNIRKAPISAQNVVTYDVVIAVSNPDLKLFPGMTANARIMTTRLDDALKVPNAVLRVRPSAAVLTQVGLPSTPAPAGKQQVYVLSGGKLKAVPVTFGISDGKSTAVTAGDLKAGELVVVRFTTSFWLEAVTLSIAGGLVGIVFGISASALISRLAGWATSVGPGAVLLAVFFSALVGVSFGYYPARRAAFLDPIEALRYE